jgi:SOS-response transcriptional repressor LexA
MKPVEDTRVDRLRLLVDSFGSIAELARAINKQPAQISQWLNRAPDSSTGKPRVMSARSARAIEQQTGKPALWMDEPLEETTTTYGQGLSGPVSDIGFTLVPVLAAVPAGDWRHMLDSHAISPEDWAAAPPRSSPGTYALRVEGVSMQPDYLHGDVVIVDPDAAFVHGSDVIVREPDGSVTFKQFVQEGAVCMIRPINPDWPGPKLIPLTDGYQIEGVVVCRYQNKRKV